MGNNIGDVFWKRYHRRERDSELRKTSIARRTTDQLHEDYYHLEQRVEKLTLISRALWELLEKETDLQERDLIAKVAEIDLRDGELDDRLKSPVLYCPNCGHKVNARNRYCIYCGFSDFPHDVFDVV
jgi:hypothetical protein